jgi:hypothetical protein
MLSFAEAYQHAKYKLALERGLLPTKASVEGGRDEIGPPSASRPLLFIGMVGDFGLSSYGALLGEWSKSQRSMLKDDGPPKEPARDKATRRWRNHAVEKAFKEEKTKLVPITPKELEVGHVIENKQRLAGSVLRAQTRFAKELRKMLEGHTHRNLLEYKLALHARNTSSQI